MNRVKKDLEAACPFAVGQNQPLSVSIITDLTCFLISHKQIYSVITELELDYPTN